jgi:hypothetical protein
MVLVGMVGGGFNEIGVMEVDGGGGRRIISVNNAAKVRPLK